MNALRRKCAIPFWRTMFAVVSFERRIALRTWRFWLLFGLLVAVGYLAWKDYHSFVEEDLYIDPALAFSHPAVGITALVLVMGAILLGVDATARLDRTRVASILYTRPMGTAAFLFGRYLAVLVVLLPLSAAGWFILPAILASVGHSDVIWQPFAVVYVAMLLPVLCLGAAVGLCLRILTGRDFVAIACTVILLGCLTWVAELLGAPVALVDIVKSSFMLAMTRAVEHARPGGWSAWARAAMWRWTLSPNLPSPALGLPVSLKTTVQLLVSSGLISLGFLAIAPLYLRRQQPQQSVIRRDARWYTLPTLRRMIRSVRVDPHLERLPKFVGLLALAGMLSGAGLAVQNSAESLALARTNRSHQERLWDNAPARDPVDVLSYDLSVDLDTLYDRLTVEGTMRIAAGGTALDRIHLRLPERFQVSTCTIGEASTTLESVGSSLRVLHIEPAIADGQSVEITLAYEGDSGGFLYPEAGQLDKSRGWYPAIYEPPRPPELTYEQRTKQRLNDVFDARLRVRGVKGSVLLAGQDLQEADAEELVELKTDFPIENLALLWGPYVAIEDRYGPTPVTFLTLEAHRYQAEVYLDEMRDRQAEILLKLGAPNLPRLLLFERPRWMDVWPDPDLGGMITVSESSLVYMHEGIWSLQRYDTNPLEVDFYLMLGPITQALQTTFLEQYITTYFQGTYEAVGPLGPWIERDLPNYVRKLMETNPWIRRNTLRFDAGEGVAAPMVRVPLAELSARAKTNPRHIRAETLRGEGLWRTVHHVLGDENWWMFVRSLLRRHHLQEVTAEDVQRVAEDVAGRSLDDFFREWVWGDALPRYELRYAEAKLKRKKNDFLAAYDCRVRIRNLGTGKIDVPIYIETEVDNIQRLVELGGGEERLFEIEVPNRPVFAAVDPSSWLLQEAHQEPGKRTRGHHEARFRILEKDGEVFTPFSDSDSKRPVQ